MCGRSACTVRREGESKSIGSPYPYQCSVDSRPRLGKVPKNALSGAIFCLLGVLGGNWAPPGIDSRLCLEVGPACRARPLVATSTLLQGSIRQMEPTWSLTIHPLAPPGLRSFIPAPSPPRGTLKRQNLTKQCHVAHLLIKTSPDSQSLRPTNVTLVARPPPRKRENGATKEQVRGRRPERRTE